MFQILWRFTTSSVLVRYGAALLGAAIILASSRVLAEPLQGLVLSIPISAVVVMALLLGTGPGTLAVAILTVGNWLLFQQPGLPHAGALHREVVRLVSFGLASIAALVAVHHMRRARKNMADAEKAARDAVEEAAERTRDVKRGEERLRLALEGAQQGIWDWDLHQQKLTCDVRCRAILGLPPDEPISIQKHGHLVHADDRQRMDDSARRALRDRAAFVEELRIHRFNGSERWVTARGRVFLDDRGQPARVTGTILDITERKVAEEALRRSEARQRAVLRGLVEGVIFVNKRGEVEDINEAVAVRHGHTFEELTDPRANAHCKMLRPDGTPFPKDELPDVMALRTGKAVRDVEMCVRTADGQLRWRLVNAQPAYDDRGNLLGAVASFFDITERKAMETQLRQANEQLVEMDRRKNEFLGMLSHELRNPLASIRNSSYILERRGVEGEQAARAVAVISRQTRQLTRLIDDLLDVTRISRGKVRLQKSTVVLQDLVTRVVEDHRSMFERSGVALEVELNATPVHVDADEARLAQVLGNLLHNGTKFTPRGGCVTVRMDASENGLGIVQVLDTGVGMEPETLGRVFEPFMQADRTLDRTRGGLGIGLALVKGIVDLHGGTITVHSEGLGKGSTFTVGIPLAAARSNPAARPLRTLRATTPRRVLVVEDNVDAAESLRDALELLGHTVQVAHDGVNGVARARAMKPDAVLCDIGLPGMDGYAVARTLRREVLVGPVLMVALTGYAAPEDQQRARDAGFDAHLPKPPNLEALATLLSGEDPKPRGATPACSPAVCSIR